MTTRELSKLKKKLPRGWREEMKKRLPNNSKSAIHQVMSGSYNNDKIIDCAIQLAQEYQESIKARKEKLDSL
jgi:hypothetical protein